MLRTLWKSYKLELELNKDQINSNYEAYDKVDNDDSGYSEISRVYGIDRVECKAMEEPRDR